ncbi:plasmodesmata-located protein 2-like [Bidens hawaiensis]|uniref:plasmodesmata-located protein 2-like n=1 Tax=Bidens hawaiensis TaxID=980011 RepID=UPI00404AF15D
MSQASKPLHVTQWILLNFMLLLTLTSSNSESLLHYTDFVYKKCHNETHIPDTLVSSLVQELVEKSAKSKFYQTSTGDDLFVVSGKFQCNHDLTVVNCHDCIVNTVTILKCSSGSLARVQLKGCFISLEPEPEPGPDQPEHESAKVDNKGLNLIVREDYLQHKKCGERRPWIEGLQEVRDVAFETFAKCVTSSGVRYCENRHEGMYAMGQCLGSMEVCECGECVSNAFQVAQDKCWGSDLGEVYLENCFISFSDYVRPRTRWP